jgi:hypothetical protein
MRYRDLFKNQEMRTISLILSYANFSLYICYYGMIFALPSIGDNPYVTALILGTSELIAYMVSSIKKCLLFRYHCDQSQPKN